ncbi:Uncharacterised protein [Weissella viridescens]|uniref:Uncharacterized protein n=1 Tax=Weissella viridescens TaxID=1629 RepID=A0A380P2R2_WEIVI|nr:Uncharacterised protein [Weissella viridescens]
MNEEDRYEYSHNTESEHHVRRLDTNSSKYSPQVFNALLTAIHDREHADIYVGRVTGSCINRIAVGDVAEQFILRFRTPTERDRFMMAFERACESAGRNVIKSF